MGLRHDASALLQPEARRLSRYGGRGITVCERWRGPEGYAHFLADMGRRPSPKHTIDRIDNDGHYEPSNCRWATKRENARNRSSNRVLEFHGDRRTIAEWSEITGIPATVIESRLRVCGYSIERALTQPLRGWGPGHPRNGNGSMASVPEGHHRIS